MRRLGIDVARMRELAATAVVMGLVAGAISLHYPPDVSAGNSVRRVAVRNRAADPKVIVPGHGGEVRSVVFSPDGKILASGSRDNTVKLWDSQTGALLRTITGHDGEAGYRPPNVNDAHRVEQPKSTPLSLQHSHR